MYTIKENIINHKNYGNKRTSIKYIVIHYTGNDGDSDESNTKYFKNTIVSASAHYFVDNDSITNTVPDDYTAWHCGAKVYRHKFCRNSNSLSIELCDSIKNGVVYPTVKTIENAIALTKALMKKYNIPKENVIRHYDVTGKLCPKYWVDDSKWKSEFWNKLSVELTSAKDIAHELNESFFPITDKKKFISELEESKKNNSSLYWGYYKLVNNIK